jgi:hypothetical protein
MSKPAKILALVSSTTALLLCVSACGNYAAPYVENGWDVYGYASAISCVGRPLRLTGNHMDLEVTGGCQHVVVAGSHNDISIALAPAGVIEITGGHNDVTWHVTAPSGVPPVLLDHGEGNSFHAAT